MKKRQDNLKTSAMSPTDVEINISNIAMLVTTGLKKIYNLIHSVEFV